MSDKYPLGKLPPEHLAALLARYPIADPRVIVGPRPGEDAAVLDVGGEQYLSLILDPITFATDEIGWYAVNVNANDIATTGGTPQWFMATLLLPGGQADPAMVDTIFEQMHAACDALGVALVGGHTEITYGIDRPIVAGMMLGQVEKARLLSTGDAQPGDRLLLTKGYPIEATAIIAREKHDLLEHRFSHEYVERCAGFLHEPGISVVRDARVALNAGRVHAMHDPTEGGLATGLWEMAEASGLRLVVDPAAALLEEGRALCEATGLDPLGAIASGALLMAVHPDDADAIAAALAQDGIPAYDIGRVEEGGTAVVGVDDRPLARPARDEIARLFDAD